MGEGEGHLPMGEEEGRLPVVHSAVDRLLVVRVVAVRRRPGLGHFASRRIADRSWFLIHWLVTDTRQLLTDEPTTGEE